MPGIKENGSLRNGLQIRGSAQDGPAQDGMGAAGFSGNFCLGIGYPLKSLLSCILSLPQTVNISVAEAGVSSQDTYVLSLVNSGYMVVVWGGDVCW